MNIERILEKLGLSQKESKVYLAILTLSKARISDVYGATGMHRPMVYKLVGGLVRKGLVTRTIKGRQKFYCVEPPEKLLMLLQESAAEFEKVLPELNDMYHASGERPLVKFFEGKKGIEHVYLDVVMSAKKGSTFYRYSSSKDVVRVDKYLPAQYKKIRNEKQLQRFVIASDAIVQRTSKDLNRMSKVVPDAGMFEYNISQIMYENKIAIVDYNTDTALVVENKQIADFHKEIFKLLYKYLPGESR